MESELFVIVSKLWLRVFVYVVCGWLVGRFWASRVEKALNVFVAVAVYGLVPMLVFLMMWESRVRWAESGRLIMATAGMTFGCALLALVLARGFQVAFRNVCLPVVFMNSLYLGLPVNTLLFGTEGGVVTIVFNIVMTIINFSLGVWWVRRPDKGLWGELFGLPILYATAAGWILNRVVPCPPVMSQVSRGLGLTVLPFMLFFVGVRMARLKTGSWQLVGAGTLARMGGGMLWGWGFAVLLGLTGMERNVLVLTAGMPSAVNTYLLAEKFESDPEFAAAMVTWGTALSAVTIPLMAWLLT
ncbi:MAG TPA: AEC family transporter [Elusimicrobiota bacterium]|nr:AEC family transporter [Elusimicrobiota bacterium]